MQCEIQKWSAVSKQFKPCKNAAEFKVAAHGNRPAKHCCKDCASSLKAGGRKVSAL